MKSSVVDSSLTNRYGHVALSNDENMYIIGGFNGMMQNDIIKYTSAECDPQAVTVKDCQRAASLSGIQCIFHNKVCQKAKLFTSYAQPFSVFNKNANPKLQADCAFNR